MFSLTECVKQLGFYAKWIRRFHIKKNIWHSLPFKRVSRWCKGPDLVGRRIEVEKKATVMISGKGLSGQQWRLIWPFRTPRTRNGIWQNWRDSQELLQSEILARHSRINTFQESNERNEFVLFLLYTFIQSLTFLFCIVVQVQLSSFSCRHFSSIFSPFCFVHETFIHVPWRTFPFFLLLCFSPLSSGYCQFVLYFNVSGYILLASCVD